MERMRWSVVRGLAAFRWLAWVWMATVLFLARGNLVAPVAAFTLVGVALVVTVWLTVLLRRDPEGLLSGPVVGIEVAVALALQLADGFVYRAPHVFTPEQPLGIGWPIAAVLSAGVALGPITGALTGLTVGGGRAVSSIANVTPAADPVLGPLASDQLLALVTTAVMYALAGGIAGYAVGLIGDAERRVAGAERAVARLRAREEVARRLHDGVLQTLAVVERRADDPQLARLARDQERDLRAFLADPDDRPEGAGALGEALLAAAGRYEAAFDGRVQVLVPDDLPAMDAEVVDGVVGAATEALTNAGKHGHAGRVVVYVEPDEEGGVVVSVRDDGEGFDPATVREGLGWSRSIRGRVEELGGRVAVTSSPGRGTQIELRVPARVEGGPWTDPGVG